MKINLEKISFWDSFWRFFFLRRHCKWDNEDDEGKKREKRKKICIIFFCCRIATCLSFLNEKKSSSTLFTINKMFIALIFFIPASCKFFHLLFLCVSFLSENLHHKKLFLFKIAAARVRWMNRICNDDHVYL